MTHSFSTKNLVAIVCLLAVVTAGAVYAAGKVMYNSDYASDRSQIEDLQARYMFALDWQDPEAYASTFTEDGQLDWAGGVAKGRDAIREEVRGMRTNFDNRDAEDAPLRPARLRHFITNVVVKIDGDTAVGRAYWFEFYNRNPERLGHGSAYGHYEDELKKVNGQWLFTKRKIFNEQMDDRAATRQNPAW